MAALDPRTLQLIMAMEPAAQQRQAMAVPVPTPADLGPQGARPQPMEKFPADFRAPVGPDPARFEGNRLAGPVPVPAAGPMGGASTSPVRPAPDFAGVQPGLWSSGTAMPSGNRLTEIAPEQMPGGNMLGKEALPPELAGMQIGMAGPNEVAYGPPAGMQSAIATNDMPMQQSQGGGLFSGFGDDKRQFFADWLMGMGMGSTINESLAKGTQYALMSKKEREEAAKGEKSANMTREAARKLGVPDDVINGLDGKSLAGLVIDIQKQRMTPAAGTTPTDDMREYDLAQSQGYDGSFQQWMLDQKRAGAMQNSVNVNNGENEFDKTNAKNLANRFDALATEGQTARQDIAKINIMRENVAQLPGGFMGGAQALASQWGIKLGENASSVEAAQAIINQLVPQQRVPGSGTMSDADLALFKQSLPALSNTPEGNRIIMDTMQAMAEYKMALGEIAEQAQMGMVAKEDAVRMLREIEDPLSRFKAFQAKMGTQPGASVAPAGGSGGYRVIGVQ